MKIHINQTTQPVANILTQPNKLKISAASGNGLDQIHVSRGARALAAGRLRVKNEAQAEAVSLEESAATPEIRKTASKMQGVRDLLERMKTLCETAEMAEELSDNEQYALSIEFIQLQGELAKATGSKDDFKMIDDETSEKIAAFERVYAVKSGKKGLEDIEFYQQVAAQYEKDFLAGDGAEYMQLMNDLMQRLEGSYKKMEEHHRGTELETFFDNPQSYLTLNPGEKVTLYTLPHETTSDKLKVIDDLGLTLAEVAFAFQTEEQEFHHDFASTWFGNAPAAPDYAAYHHAKSNWVDMGDGQYYSRTSLEIFKTQEMDYQFHADMEMLHNKGATHLSHHDSLENLKKSIDLTLSKLDHQQIVLTELNEAILSYDGENRDDWKKDTHLTKRLGNHLKDIEFFLSNEIAENVIPAKEKMTFRREYTGDDGNSYYEEGLTLDEYFALDDMYQKTVRQLTNKVALYDARTAFYQQNPGDAWQGEEMGDALLIF